VAEKLNAKRLQTQETMTSQILGNPIEDVLKPQGVAVLIDAKHEVHDHPRRPPSERLDDHHAVLRRLPLRQGTPRTLPPHGGQAGLVAAGHASGSQPYSAMTMSPLCSGRA